MRGVTQPTDEFVDWSRTARGDAQAIGAQRAEAPHLSPSWDRAALLRAAAQGWHRLNPVVESSNETLERLGADSDASYAFEHLVGPLGRCRQHEASQGSPIGLSSGPQASLLVCVDPQVDPPTTLVFQRAHISCCTHSVRTRRRFSSDPQRGSLPVRPVDKRPRTGAPLSRAPGGASTAGRGTRLSPSPNGESEALTRPLRVGKPDRR